MNWFRTSDQSWKITRPENGFPSFSLIRNFFHKFHLSIGPEKHKISLIFNSRFQVIWLVEWIIMKYQSYHIGITSFGCMCEMHHYDKSSWRHPNLFDIWPKHVWHFAQTYFSFGPNLFFNRPKLAWHLAQICLTFGPILFFPSDLVCHSLQVVRFGVSSTVT